MTRRGPKLGTRGNTPLRPDQRPNHHKNPGDPGGGGVHIRQRTPAAFLTRAACATHPDPDLWHPNETKLADHLNPQVVQATRICDQCPVKIQCLHWALENRAPDGIYGGMTPRQRGLITRSAQRWQQRKEST